MNVPFSTVYCLVKHTLLKEQAAKAWRLIKKGPSFMCVRTWDGTEKFPFLVTGKSKQPWYIENTWFLPCT
jgi:hypothetical protein